MREKKQNNNCLHCNQKEVELVRMVVDEKGRAVRTKTAISVCINPKCWSHIDISQVKNWVRK